MTNRPQARPIDQFAGAASVSMAHECLLSIILCSRDYKYLRPSLKMYSRALETRLFSMSTQFMEGIDALVHHFLRIHNTKMCKAAF